MRTLTICPTCRPNRFAEMLDSFLNTRQGDTDLVAYVAEDDPRLEEYRAIFARKGFFYLAVGPRLSLVEAINYCVKYYRGYDYYQEVNDDHVYITPGWDLKLTQALETSGGVGIAWGRDGGPGNKETPGLPTAAVISGNLVRGLGYFFPPEFKHTFCDNALLDLARACNLIRYCPDVIIEHRHVIFGKAELDESYRKVMSREALNEGRRIYEDWQANKFATEVEGIKNVITENRRPD